MPNHGSIGEDQGAQDETTVDAYIHGFSDWEHVRLVDQARALAPRVFEGMHFSSAQSVLEIGCAVGAELKLLLERWPHLTLTGLDRSASQIGQAHRLLKPEVEQGVVHLVQGDACNLPWPARSFDRVITIWALEHIPDTEAAIQEALRVVRETGELIMTEVDNHTFGFQPGCQAITEWWKQFSGCQADAGGDPYVGRSLADIARNLGAARVTEEVLHIIDSHNEPNRRLEFLDYLENLLLSGADAMKSGGYADDRLEMDMRKDFARARSDPSIHFQYHAVRVSCRPSPKTDPADHVPHTSLPEGIPGAPEHGTVSHSLQNQRPEC